MQHKDPYNLFQLLAKKNLALHQQFEHGSGKKIILLHGLGGSGRYWTKPSKYLAQKFKIISYDLLGFGESPHPEPFEYHAWQQADALRQAMWNDHIWGKTNIVGHSLGALVALKFAKRYPKKVDKLILSNIPIIYSPQQLTDLRNNYTDILDNIKNELQRRGLKKLRESEFAHKKIMPRYAERQMQDQAFTDYDLNHLSKYAYAQSIKHAIENQTTLDNLDNVTMPVYIIRANRDRLVIKGNIDKLASRLPNCKIIDVESRHQYPVLQPGDFAGKLMKILEA